MKLLICAQAVDRNDPILGFFHRWLEEFAQHCEQVLVFAQRTGEYSLPANVSVFSLGKEDGLSRPQQVLRFMKLMWEKREAYDAVFVHMSPEYVLAGGVFWQLLGKRIMLWYTHKDVSWRLRAAVVLADVIVTASKESFRLETPKVRIMGHGIDTELFKPGIPNPGVGVRILTVGRISSTKRLLEMLEVLDELERHGENFHFTIVGKPMTASEFAYGKELEQAIAKRPYASKVHMQGSVEHTKLPALLSQADIFLNFSTTGSMDKAVLEAMAVGVPVITSNEAFRKLLDPHGLWVFSSEPRVVCNTIEQFMKRADRAQVSQLLRKEVQEHHALSRLIPAIIRELD